MTTRRARGVALLVTAATLALAAGCSSDAISAAPVSVTQTNLTVAVVPALDSAGFFIALYQGLFRARGLNVHFVPATSSETVINSRRSVRLVRRTSWISPAGTMSLTSRPSRTGTRASGRPCPPRMWSPPTWTSSPKAR